MKISTVVVPAVAEYKEIHMVMSEDEFNVVKIALNKSAHYGLEPRIISLYPENRDAIGNILIQLDKGV